MAHDPISDLLRDCRRGLTRFFLPGRDRHALVARIDGYLEATHAEQTFPDAIIAYAGDSAILRGGVQIDPDETETRPHPDGVQVRAWYLVPHTIIASFENPDPLLQAAFAALPPLTQRILILRMREGMPVEAIARDLGLGPRRVRRHIHSAVVAIRRAVDSRTPLV